MKDEKRKKRFTDLGFELEQRIWVEPNGLEWVGPKFWRAGLKK